MYRYIIGIGSNINPQHNVPRILTALLDLADEIQTSRIIQTAPSGMDSQRPFLNLAASLLYPDEAAALKTRFNTIETRLGRDRAAPDSSVRDRPADLDILLQLSPDAQTIASATLPPEPYLRPVVVDLLRYLELEIVGDTHVDSDEASIQLLTEAGPLGHGPCTLRRDPTQPAGFVILPDAN